MEETTIDHNDAKWHYFCFYWHGRCYSFNHSYVVHTMNVVSSGIVSPRVSIGFTMTRGQKKMMSKPNSTNIKNVMHVFDLGGLGGPTINPRNSFWNVFNKEL
jgi:hypothetical protein